MGMLTGVSNICCLLLYSFSGKITCANVLSDLYATGIVEIDKLQMILGLSTKFTTEEQDVVIPLIIKGFEVTSN